MIIRFKSEQEYQEWLRWQSWKVKEKAKKFAEKYGYTIPIVIAVEFDSSQTCDSAAAHIFVHPQADELLKLVIVE